MPRVPRYTGRQVRTAPLPSIRRTPQQEGAGVGQALSEFGDTALRLSYQFANTIVAEQQDEADRVALTTAERQLGELEHLLLAAPDKGALHVTGKDTLPLRNTVLADFDEQAGMIASNLTNARQRMAFERAKDHRRQSMLNTIDRHTVQEMRAYTVGEAKAAITTAVNLGIANATNPERVGEELARIDGLFEQYGGAMGLNGPEQLKAAKAEARSKVHIGVVEQLLSTEQTTKARAYFEEVRGEIEGDDLDRLERAVRAGSVKGEAQAAADKILAQGGTFAEQREKAKQLTDPDVRDLTLQYIEHEELVQERAERDANEARSRQVYDVLDTGKGIRAIPPQVWAQMSGPERSAARSYAKSLAEVGTAAIKTDMGSLYDLLTLSSVNPDAFLKTNLLHYRNRLSNGDLEQMMRKQADMRGGKSGSEIFATEGLQNEVIDAGLASMGLDLTPADLRKNPNQAARVNQFRRAVREAVDRQFPPSAGKRATRADVQAIVDTLAAETGTKRTGWLSSSPAYAFEEAQAQVETVNQVPVGERRKIEAALRNRGIPVSDDRIVQLFNAQLSRVRKDR